MGRSPYLQQSRLADILAAIQFMSLNERSSLSCARWAEGMSGDASKADHWRRVFLDHPEFFRKSPDNDDHYALIWRRALPRRYFRKADKMLTMTQLEALPEADKAFVSRPPVPEQQIKTLIEIAVELHTKAREHHTDWRWWVPIVASFAGSLIAVLLGLAFRG